MISPVTRFSLDTADAEQTAKSILLMDGQPVGRVRGNHIDAQFAVGQDGHVVFVSFDDLFSALEAIYFVDPAGRIRDEVSLGDATAQGLITEITVTGDDRIAFAFPMNERQVLRIAREPRLLGFRERWLHVD